jgi:hypothetical protein
MKKRPACGTPQGYHTGSFAPVPKTHHCGVRKTLAFPIDGRRSRAHVVFGSARQYRCDPHSRGFANERQKNRRVALYARVSTGTQTVENQLRELREVAERHGWIVVAEFKDAGISGAKGRNKRSGLDRLMHAVARREVDMVAAWSVDRLSRSLQDLLGFLGEIHGKGVDLYLHQQGIDTSTPAGVFRHGIRTRFSG